MDMHYNHCHRATADLQLNIIIIIIIIIYKFCVPPTKCSCVLCVNLGTAIISLQDVK
jgi:hypothetical protein